MDRQKRLLIVDDDDQVAAMYIAHFDTVGYATQRVSNGEGALSAALEFKPDLILLDVMMPKVDGFEVLDILRNTDQTKKIPVIMLTALGEEEDREKATGSGAVDYFVKSGVDLDIITQKIEERLKEAESY